MKTQHNVLLDKVLRNYGRSGNVTDVLKFNTEIAQVKKLFVWIDNENRKEKLKKMDQQIQDAEDMCGEFGIYYEKKTETDIKLINSVSIYRSEVVNTELAVTTTAAQREAIVHEYCRINNEQTRKVLSNRLEGKEGPEKVVAGVGEKAVEMVRNLKNKPLRENNPVFTLSLDVGEIVMMIKLNSLMDDYDWEMFETVTFTGFEGLPEELHGEMLQLVLERIAERLHKESDVSDTAAFLIWDSERRQYRNHMYIFFRLKENSETKQSWL